MKNVTFHQNQDHGPGSEEEFEEDEDDLEEDEDGEEDLSDEEDENIEDEGLDEEDDLYEDADEDDEDEENDEDDIDEEDDEDEEDMETMPMKSKKMTSMTNTPERSEIMTAYEVAELYRVNRKTVYDAYKRGQLPGSHIGRLIRFYRPDVIEWLRGNVRGSRSLRR